MIDRNSDSYILGNYAEFLVRGLIQRWTRFAVASSAELSQTTSAPVVRNAALGDDSRIHLIKPDLSLVGRGFHFYVEIKGKSTQGRFEMHNKDVQLMLDNPVWEAYQNVRQVAGMLFFFVFQRDVGEILIASIDELDVDGVCFQGVGCGDQTVTFDRAVFETWARCPEDLRPNDRQLRCPESIDFDDWEPELADGWFEQRVKQEAALLASRFFTDPEEVVNLAQEPERARRLRLL